MKTINVIMVALAFLIVIALPSAYGATSISSCQTLSSGGHYELSQNVSNAGTCFTITSANVHLDCKGYWIIGTSSGHGITGSQTNTSIRNCNIQGFWYGMGDSLGSNSLVENVTIFNQARDCIRGDGSNVEFKDINCTSPGRSCYTIQSGGNTNVTLDNFLCDRSGRGMILDNIGSIVIKNSVIKDCVGTDDQYKGIRFVDDGTNRSIYNTKVHNCGSLTGIYVGDYYGGATDPGNVFMYNVNASYNGDYGIQIGTEGTGNVMDNVTVLGNGLGGIYFQSADSDLNTLDNSRICDNTNWDIRDADSNTGDDNTCDNVYQTSWNDTGTTGCTNTCAGDTSPPSVTIYSPTNTSYPNPLVWLNVSANETIDTWWYLLNAGSNTTFTPNITINGSEGSNTVTVWANDTAGNEGQSSVSFTIDTTSPTITIVLPANTTYASTTVSLNVSANENIDTWWYSLNGGSNTTFSSNTSITATEGANNIIVWGNDTVGNEGSSIAYFSVDTTAPNITVYSPLATTYSTSSIPLEVSANEIIDTWWYLLNNGTNTTFTPNTTITATEGSNTITIWVNDSLGNIGSSMVTFTYEVPPVLPVFATAIVGIILAFGWIVVLLRGLLEAVDMKVIIMAMIATLFALAIIAEVVLF